MLQLMARTLTCIASGVCVSTERSLVDMCPARHWLHAKIVPALLENNQPHQVRDSIELYQLHHRLRLIYQLMFDVVISVP
jgi:hypothetical protein